MAAVSSNLRLFGLYILLCIYSNSCWAQIGSERYSSLTVDALTGQVLSSANADDLRDPGGLAKLMTIYLVFERIRDHRLSLKDGVPVSVFAASMPPTRLGLKAGTEISVEQAVLGVICKSANDAAVALSELFGGDGNTFADMMTARAHELGMTGTVFHNSTGLPDFGQTTTARDQVTLARHLIQDFPELYHLLSAHSFTFQNRLIPNNMNFISEFQGADGLKTAFSETAGYSMVASAVRGDVRLIGVVFGLASATERDSHIKVLLNQGFLRLGIPAAIEIVRRRNPSLIQSASSTPVSASTESKQSLLPARELVRPAPIPPPGTSAYGVFAIRSRPTTNENRERLTMACRSFLNSLTAVSDLPDDVTSERVVATLWPMMNPPLDQSNFTDCNRMLTDYAVFVADAAIDDARRQHARVSGQGPYLIGWKPASSRGKADQLVLVIDMSGFTSQERFDEAFAFWKKEIVDRPELWRRGWSVESLRLAIRDFANKYGKDISSAAHLTR